MSKLDLVFAELHNPFFMAGKNFGTKLDPSKLSGLKLVYDRAEKELLVSWSDRTSIVPSSNIVSIEQGIVEEKPFNQMHPIVQGKITAQVSTPQSHVFAGEGHGKTGKS